MRVDRLPDGQFDLFFRPSMVHRWSTRGRKGSFFVVIRRTKKSLEDFVIIRNLKNFENLEKVLKSAHNPKVRGSNPLPATNFEPGEIG